MLLLPDREWEAIEYELIRAGWTLEDVPRRLSWMALDAFVEHLPQDSALGRVRDPHAALWTLTPHLLAEAVYRLQVLHWVQTEDGQKNLNPPERIERPGVTNPNKKRMGSGTVLVSEWDDWWNGGL